MSKKSTDFLDYGIEEEIDPKIKFNSLLSVTVSTVMCLAAKCPLPKSNVETTKLFLSTISDDNGQNPRNIKGFLTLLTNYQGPYESVKEKRFDKPPAEKPPEDNVAKEKKEHWRASSENLAESQAAANSSSGKEIIPVSHLPHSTDTLAKRSQKAQPKRNEKDPAKKTSKTLGSKVSYSRSLLSNKF